MIAPPERARSGRPRLLPAAALLFLALVFASLGAWQVKRLAWKEALIARVDAATHAPPLDIARLPPPMSQATIAALEYRRVTLSGHFEPQGTTLVTASSDLGNGYWDLVPLRMDSGRTIYINRGFVPLGSKREAIATATPTGPVSIVGLFRLDEPHGTFMRANHPEAERWYSRDVSAMAARRGVAVEAGWFVDSQGETPHLVNAPIAGLTVLQFPNNHLSYAITWFVLSLLSLGGIFLVSRTQG